MLRLILLFSFVLVSCGEKDFVPRKNVDQSQFQNSRGSEVLNGCNTRFQENRPKVDLLFVWDNSPSTKFINNDTKTALESIVSSISDRFDYHIMIAPLNYSSGQQNNNLYLDTYDDNGLTSNAINMKNSYFGKSASDYLGTIAGVANGIGYEQGIERARQVVLNNRSNGVFRSNAHTILVLMSTGDVAYGVQPGNYITPAARETYINAKVSELNGLKSTLSADQLRLMTIVAHSECRTGYRRGYGYQQTSLRLNPGKNDSFDICTTAFVNMFDGINNSIQSEIIRYKYDHFAIAPQNIPNFDTNDLTVKDTSGNIIPNNTSNGWQYIGNTTANTRYFPTPGDPYTGHLLRLYGDARLDFGECLQVITREPIAYYGFILLKSKPNPETIQLRIDGTTVPKADLSQPVLQRNGWEYIGEHISKNIKVKNRVEFNVEGFPADYNSGFMIRLYGNYIIDNTKVTEIDVRYFPSN